MSDFQHYVSNAFRNKMHVVGIDQIVVRYQTFFIGNMKAYLTFTDFFKRVMENILSVRQGNKLLIAFVCNSQH